MFRKLVGAAMTAALALWSAAAAAETVKIGLIASYTGPFATWGVQFQRGVEAYQSVHGKTVKGPDGREHEIQLIYRDSTSAGPDKAKQLAEELVLRERVKFLTGLELSPYAMALNEISQQAKVPVVMMNAATAMITRMSPYFVRVSLTIPQVVVPAAQWAYQNGIRKVYVVVSDYAPGYDAETYFAKTFKALGGEIVGMARTPQQETNFSAYMERVLQAKPDALYMFQPVGSVSIAFVKAYAERGLKAAGIKLIGGAESRRSCCPISPTRSSARSPPRITASTTPSRRTSRCAARSGSSTATRWSPMRRRSMPGTARR
jgi:branched-chain amino acid transport system substrate-binding protein